MLNRQLQDTPKNMILIENDNFGKYREATKLGIY